MIRKTHSFYYLAFFISISVLVWLNTQFDNQRQTQLSAITNSGEIRISSTSSSDTYYLTNNNHSGFEYELAQAFADYLGVNLKLTIRADSQQIANDLATRDSHISIPGRSKLPVANHATQNSASYTKNQSIVVYRQTRGVKSPKEEKDLIGRTIILAANSQQELQMLLMQASYPQLNWNSTNTLTTYEILERLLAKEIDVAVVSQTDFAAVGPFFPNLKAAFKLGEPVSISWQIANKKDQSLKIALNNFFSLPKTKLLIDELETKYYQSSNPLNLFDTLTFKNDFNNRLPDLEEYFKQAAKETDIDWLLLAAIAYQESHWNPKAVSSTGVKGIMMLTKAAAKEVKVTDRTDPKQSVFGGAHYLVRVKNKIPDRIKDPDRTFLALAGYNTGFGHLEDARILAKRAGLNPDLWSDVRKTLPLLTKPKYYTTVKHGYARGYEPVNYVKNIRKYLTILKWEIDQQTLKQEANLSLTPPNETPAPPEEPEADKISAPSTL